MRRHYFLALTEVEQNFYPYLVHAFFAYMDKRLPGWEEQGLETAYLTAQFLSWVNNQHRTPLLDQTTLNQFLQGW